MGEPTVQPRPLLLVEDEPDDVEFVRRALAAAHILNRLVVVSNSAAAREYLTGRAADALPAAILIDIHLAGDANGLEVLKWIRAQAPPVRDLRALILTVSIDRTHQIRAAELDAALFLFKPVTADVLVEALRRLGLVISALPSGAGEYVELT